MLNLGVIGTNSISHEFVSAALKTEKYALRGVYSRTLEKAKAFGEPYGAEIFEEDLESFAKRPELDVIYIASPNSLHYEQALMMMRAGKHVIVEKPMFSTTNEWKEAVSVAEENNVFLFDAARHIHEENFKVVKEEVQKLDTISGATFFYMKYSSRFDNVLAGEEPNVFSLKYSGGALADLGVYPIYAAIAWFGMPESSHYFATKIPTGVDGKGTTILRYKDFDVTILAAKMVNSFLPSEIYSLKKTFLLNGINMISSIEVHEGNGQKSEIAKTAATDPMIDEAHAFADVLLSPSDEQLQNAYREWQDLSGQVIQVLEDLRKDAGIVYEADKNVQ